MYDIRSSCDVKSLAYMQTLRNLIKDHRRQVHQTQLSEIQLTDREVGVMILLKQPLQSFCINVGA